MTSTHSLVPARALLLSLVVIAVLLRLVEAHISHRSDWVSACPETSMRLSVRIESVDFAIPGARYHTTMVRTLTPDDKSRPDCSVQSGVRLRLAWPVATDGPLRGESWEINARVRPPTGFANPAGFDFERWLFSEGIAGTGYVREAQRIAWETKRVAWIEGQVLTDLRGAIREYLLAPADEASEGEQAAGLRWSNGGVLLALALADGTAVSDAQWRWFRDTGTIHLIIVSGLHIVIVAALGAIPGLLIGRCVVMFQAGFPTRLGAAATGFMTALGYTALTGYEVPAVRAVIFFGLGVGVLLMARRLPPITLFSFALLLTLLVMPLSPLASGFWLSFVAVGVLLVAESAVWRVPQNLLTTKRFLRSQAMLSVGLMSWLAVLLGSVSLTGPWVNLAVVPLVSVVVLPLLLLGCVLVPVAEFAAFVPVYVADFAMGLVMRVIETAAEPPALRTSVHEPGVVVVALITGLLLVWPIRLRLRVVLLPLVLLPLVPAWPRLPQGEFLLEVLDVGQGSAALIQTRHTLLVMDSGPRFPSGFDTGEAIVLPAIASAAVREPDVVVITHPDIDHAGGKEALARAFPNTLVFGSDPASGIVPCQGFPAWRRDGVAFQLLPGDGFPDFSSANDRSCALLVDNGRQAVLLTGDTSDHAEMLLIRDARPEVLDRLEVVVVPHHGSRSSSSRAFVRRTSPRYAVVSAGRHNGYGHPHPQVVSRWQQAGARVVSTSESGAIRWYSGAPGVLHAFRSEAPRYWRTTEST